VDEDWTYINVALVLLALGHLRTLDKGTSRASDSAHVGFPFVCQARSTINVSGDMVLLIIYLEKFNGRSSLAVLDPTIQLLIWVHVIEETQ